MYVNCPLFTVTACPTVSPHYTCTIPTPKLMSVWKEVWKYYSYVEYMSLSESSRELIQLRGEERKEVIYFLESKPMLKMFLKSCALVE